MTLISLLLLLIVLAVVVWAVRTLIPVLGIPQPIATVIYVVLVLIVVLYVVSALGYGIGGLRVH